MLEGYEEYARDKNKSNLKRLLSATMLGKSIKSRVRKMETKPWSADTYPCNLSPLIMHAVFTYTRFSM